jgi:hypothetical protein
MYGKITFNNATQLAEFLKEFTGSTAVFVVRTYGDTYELEFTGGY